MKKFLVLDPYKRWGYQKSFRNILLFFSNKLVIFTNLINFFRIDCFFIVSYDYNFKKPKKVKAANSNIKFTNSNLEINVKIVKTVGVKKYYYWVLIIILLILKIINLFASQFTAILRRIKIATSKILFKTKWLLKISEITCPSLLRSNTQHKPLKRKLRSICSY